VTASRVYMGAMTHPISNTFVAACFGLASLGFASLGFAPAALAESPADMARIEVLPGWQMDNGHQMAAIRITLAPGWHTYWRAPGEAGIPPQFDWSGSENVSAVTVHWPVPELFSQNGMWYLGYEREVVLPIEITPNAAGDIALDGVMDLGVCNDICMPLQAAIGATFAQNARTGSIADSGQIRKALTDQPQKITGARCSATPLSDGMRLTATLNVPHLGPREVAIVEHPDRYMWVSEAMVTRTGSSVSVQSDLVPSDAQPFMVDRSALTITVIGGGQAYEAQGCTGGS